MARNPKNAAAHKIASPFGRRRAFLQPGNAHPSELFREYYYLYKIAATLTAEMDVNRTLREVKKIVREMFRPQQYSVMLLAEDGKTLRLKSYFGFTRAPQQDLSLEGTVFGKVVRRKHSFYLPDLKTAATHSPLHPGRRRREGAFLSLPLFIHGHARALGVLNLYRRQPNSFSPNEIRLLRKIAEQLAQVLDKIFLYHQTRALSITDPLTGIFNRRYFNERYATEFMRASRYQRPLSVIMLDLDHFKKFNDAHGHLLGDKVLRMAAHVLEASIRQADILARYGGEEFVVILPEIDKVHGKQVAEKLRRAIENAAFPKAEHQPFGRLTASVGLASFPEDAEEGDALLSLADQALYEAKARGRNQVAAASEGKTRPRRKSKTTRASYATSRSS